MIERLEMRVTPVVFLAVLAAAALAVAWGAAVIAISFVTLGLYAVSPSTALMAIHDEAGLAAAAAVAAAAATLLIRQMSAPSP